ncbi:MAG: alanine racemase [Cyclobacteriaceae bacterium]|nr:alanine racemase [Cyclobacteriaceae bacterium]
MEKLKYERPVIQKLNTGLMNKFGMVTEYDPMTNIDGVPVKRITKDYGSPVFVLSENKIREKYKEIHSAFSLRYPKVQFAWSYKTNYLNAVCNVFHQEGSWAEVVSGFEYKKALLNGMSGDKIIFNGPDKSEEDLRSAIQNGSLIHIDHLDELYLLANICENSENKAKVAIRVNMDTGIYPMWDRFGLNYDNGQAWDAINKIMASKNLNLVGLHCHIGTFMLSPSAYGVAATKLADLAVRVKQKFGKVIEYIDLGGGFPSPNNLKGAYLPGQDQIPPIDEFAETIATALLNSAISPQDLPLLILETGRAMVDEAGYLIGTVIANKRLTSGKRATILDVGINVLFTSFWYNHKVTPAQEFTDYREDMELFGPLCMNIDVIRDSIQLPSLKRGDQVVIQNVGAYNMTQWMQFITLRPKIVMIDTNQNVHVIRNDESVEYINSMELVPDHLKSFEV